VAPEHIVENFGEAFLRENLVFVDRVEQSALDLVDAVIHRPRRMADGDVRIFVEVSNDIGDFLGDQAIVVGEVEEVFAASQPQGTAHVGNHPHILCAPDVADRHSPLDEFLGDRAGIVRRGVVGNDDFIGEIEAEIAMAPFQAIVQVFLTVVGGDAYAEFDGRHRISST
jgi:hypothetical protein